MATRVAFGLRNAVRALSLGPRFLVPSRTLASFQLVKRNSSSSAIFTRLTDSIRKQDKFDVLQNPAIKSLRSQMSLLVYEDEEVFEIFKEVLESPLGAHLPPMKDNESLKRKLAYRLGCIVVSLKRLTFAIENHLLNDYEKYEVLARTILKEAINSNDVQALSSIKELGLGSLDDEMIQNLFAYYDNELEEDSDDEEADSIPNNYSYFLNRANHRVRDLKEKENQSADARDLEALLVLQGTKVDAPDNVEFNENLLASIDRDIQVQVDQLRADFPHIERYVNKLKLVALRSWLSSYDDEFLPADSHQESSSQAVESSRVDETAMPAAEINYFFDESSKEK